MQKPALTLPMTPNSNDVYIRNSVMRKSKIQMRNSIESNNKNQ